MKQNVPAHRILLAVTGLSPQVITETLYALAVCHEPWVPTEIHLITTVQGATRARLALLSEDPAWFERLLEDYKLPSITFEEKHIHVLEDEKGQPLEDIRRPEDNERAADAITALVQAFTSDPESALHVSIAGGRKTMGYYLGYALSLFGRPQDRLSHVLVSEPFESCWDFFYPTPYSKVIQTRDGALADTKDADVTLAEIPFVSLRHGLDKRLLQGKVTFSEAVNAARRSLGPPSLHLDLLNGYVYAGGTMIRLAPANLALLSVFTRRAMNSNPPLQAPPKEVPDPEWAERYLIEYRRIKHHTLDDTERTEKALANGMDGHFFSSLLSKLHRKLKQALGNAAVPYLIDNSNTRPRRYKLNLSPKAISYGDVSEPERQHTFNRNGISPSSNHLVQGLK